MEAAYGVGNFSSNFTENTSINTGLCFVFSTFLLVWFVLVGFLLFIHIYRAKVRNCTF